MLVGAHYDHLGKDGSKIYRGADDNAAAVAILVEVARALAAERPRSRMNLAGEQLVMDTNILVYWLRGKQAGACLRAAYDLGARRPRTVVPVVVKAEIKSFALQRGWGPQRLDALDELLRDLPVADISAEPVLERTRCSITDM